MIPQRQQFARTVTDLMADDQRIVLLLADIGTFAFREAFDAHPTRCYNTGATEQATVSLAAGLAKSGLFPIFSTIASFMVRRAFESVMAGFGINHLPGLLVSVGAEGYPGLGKTHACPEDIILMQQIPGMRIRLPKSADQVDSMIREAVSPAQLTYIRLTNS